MADQFAETSPKRSGIPVMALLVVAAIAFTYGIGIGISSLREPDTCFLLAMGRWICQHRALPKDDPFSYTFALFPQEHGLIIYQWLTEVIFYTIAKLSGALGLVIFTCGMLTLSLVILPLRLINCFKIDTLRGMLIVLLIVIGSIERIMLKPEIFSYLFLALYLEVMVKHETEAKRDKISWALPLFLTIAMILWANLHSGFVIGLGLLLVLSLRDSCMVGYSWILKKRDNRSFLSLWTISLFFCLVGSLATPYGVALWQYIPCLYFHPVNRYIGELQPITIGLVLHNLPLLVAFGGLLILALIRAINILRSSMTPSNLAYLVIALIGVTLGLLFQRLITFGLLLMLPLIGSGFSVKSAQALGGRYLLLSTIIMLSAIAGGFSTVLLHKPTIPVMSKAFKPPFRALKFIEENSPQGNLLNDPEFGDVLLWNSQKPPKVFADTRFDIYPWQVLQDYIAMAEAHSDWEKLCTKYKIRWIFLPPSALLCLSLQKDTSWQLIFKDDYAEIFVRKK